MTPQQQLMIINYMYPFNNSQRDELVAAFYDLVKNNLYPID